MKRHPLILFLLLFSQSFSQTWQWAKSAGGLNAEYGNSVCTSSTGDVYVTGSFYSATITFGTTVLTNASTGTGDVFLAKYDAAGNVIWANRAGGGGDDLASAVATDAFGNVFVTGYFTGTTSVFGTATLTNTNAGFGDMFLAKYNSSGSFLWAKSTGGTDWDIAQALATDPNGDVYIAGGFSMSVNFGTGTVTSGGLMDVFLGKYDQGGNELWAWGSGGANNYLANGVVTDAAGKIYIAGGFASASLTFGTNVLLNAGVGFPDIFFAKFDGTGNPIWSTREGGPDNDHAVWVSDEHFGEIYITGHYHSATFVADTSALYNAGMGDVFVMKYDTAGNVKWAKSHGGMDNDFALGLSSDASGNAYVSGMFTSPSISFGSFILTNSSANEDAFITKYDSAGNVIWAVSTGGAGNDYANSVCISSAGNLFATGSFESVSVNFGTNTLTNADNTGNTPDLFLAKLDVLTGENNFIESEQISIYPNPSNGIFNLSVNHIDSETMKRVSVCNVLGEEIYNGEIGTSANRQIDISNQPKGIYFVKIISETRISSGKIAIE